MRSPITPTIGAISVPMNSIDPNSVSSTTEPVSTSTYQPRMIDSISKAQEVTRSAGHWKRKLRTRKGASAEVALTVGRFDAWSDASRVEVLALAAATADG